MTMGTLNVKADTCTANHEQSMMVQHIWSKKNASLPGYDINNIIWFFSTLSTDWPVILQALAGEFEPQLDVMWILQHPSLHVLYFNVTQHPVADVALTEGVVIVDKFHRLCKQHIITSLWHLHITYRWLSTRLQYLQCISDGDIAVLH